MNKQITSLAEANAKDLVRLLRDIIALASFSGEEENVVLRLKQEMEVLGYEQISIDPWGNLFGRIGSGDKIILVDGHCDTVGTGNIELWKCDPFQGALSENTIYGRGAADQKGGLASAIYAGAIIKKYGIPEGVSYLVSSSVMEEDYEGACLQLALEHQQLIPDVVLLTEPTNLRICLGQRGRLELKVRTEGVSCHGSAPERGENAIYKMSAMLAEIEQLNNRLSSNSILGKGSVTVTNIRSSAPSLCAVPDFAEIHLDRRLTESESEESALHEIMDLEAVKKNQALVYIPEYEAQCYTNKKITGIAYFPMWLMDRGEPHVQLAQQAFKQQFSKEAELGVWDFSTNGVATKGIMNIPTIGFGPGEEQYAHSPHDQVNIDDLIKAAEFYAAFALSYK